MTPGPCQAYALQARKAIAVLHEWETCVEVEICWGPAHKEFPGNEIADGWAKQATSEPGDHGVEWLSLANGARLPAGPTSLAQGIGKEVAGSPVMVRAELAQQGVRPPGESQALSQSGEASGLEVLPAQSGRVLGEHG